MSTRRPAWNGHARGGDPLRQIVEGLTEGFLSFGADWQVLQCNLAAERLLRCSAGRLRGRNFWRASGISARSAFGELCQRVARSRRAEDAEIVLRGRSAPRTILVQIFPLAPAVAAVFRDVSVQRTAERALAEREARYRELVDDSPAAAWVSRVDGGLEFINQAMAETLGRPRKDLLDEGWISALDPADAANFLSARQVARETHGAVRYEGRFRHADGGLRIVELYARPRFDHHGDFAGFIGTANDVTELRDFQRRQQLILSELNHRVKNTLATVQSIVGQTLRESRAPADAARLIRERLTAYALAHDLLTQESWRGAELTDLARLSFASYGSERISLAGEPVRLEPKVALAVYMALHELATNAAKHGALSRPGGRVRLTWRRKANDVLLEWRERGGPPVTRPSRAGFGSRLLGPGLTGELGAPARVTYARSGVVCRITAPVQVPTRGRAAQDLGRPAPQDPCVLH